MTTPRRTSHTRDTVSVASLVVSIIDNVVQAIGQRDNNRTSSALRSETLATMIVHRLSPLLSVGAVKPKCFASPEPSAAIASIVEEGESQPASSSQKRGRRSRSKSVRWELPDGAQGGLCDERAPSRGSTAGNSLASSPSLTPLPTPDVSHSGGRPSFDRSMHEGGNGHSFARPLSTLTAEYIELVLTDLFLCYPTLYQVVYVPFLRSRRLYFFPRLCITLLSANYPFFSGHERSVEASEAALVIQGALHQLTQKSRRRRGVGV